MYSHFITDASPTNSHLHIPRLKAHVSTITESWKLYWSVYLLSWQEHTPMDISTCNKTTRWRGNWFFCVYMSSDHHMLTLYHEYVKSIHTDLLDTSSNTLQLWLFNSWPVVGDSNCCPNQVPSFTRPIHDIITTRRVEPWEATQPSASRLPALDSPSEIWSPDCHNHEFLLYHTHTPNNVLFSFLVLHHISYKQMLIMTGDYVHFNCLNASCQ